MSGEDEGAVLEIGRFESKCSACGKGAVPEEDAHLTEIGWGGTKAGCGAVYVRKVFTYGPVDVLPGRFGKVEWQ